MTEKEIGELRRRMKPDKCNIGVIRGCYVSESKEIISEFDQPLVTIASNEQESIISIFRKSLSGKQGRNLLDIGFSTNQVAQNSPEHGLLMKLRESKLKDDDAVHSFFTAVSSTLDLHCSYMILLAADAYDVPYQSSNDETMEDASTSVFRYIMCAVCPIKLNKPALSYYTHESRFYSCAADGMVCPPSLGFMFPAFDDRATNIYGALYYTKDVKNNYPEFADIVFKRELPMPAAAQKETFESILGEALGDDCSMDIVQSVQEELCAIIEEHKENKIEENLTVTRKNIADILSSNGIAAGKVETFEELYNQDFGYDAPISPLNVVDTKKMQVKTPDVTIQVNPARPDLIETRVINGARYILIRADEGVEVNGININIK